MSYIDHIPPEIIQKIAEYLSLNDLGNGMLVSKKWNRSIMQFVEREQKNFPLCTHPLMSYPKIDGKQIIQKIDDFFNEISFARSGKLRIHSFNHPHQSINIDWEASRKRYFTSFPTHVLKCNNPIQRVYILQTNSDCSSTVFQKEYTPSYTITDECGQMRYSSGKLLITSSLPLCFTPNDEINFEQYIKQKVKVLDHSHGENMKRIFTRRLPLLFLSTVASQWLSLPSSIVNLNAIGILISVLQAGYEYLDYDR